MYTYRYTGSCHKRGIKSSRPQAFHGLIRGQMAVVCLKRGGPKTYVRKFVMLRVGARTRATLSAGYHSPYGKFNLQPTGHILLSSTSLSPLATWTDDSVRKYYSYQYWQLHGRTSLSPLTGSIKPSLNLIVHIRVYL